MTFRPQDLVVKNPQTWVPSEFDAWGAGQGVGTVLEVLEETPDQQLLDVRWPTGRAYQWGWELFPAPQ